MRRRLILIIASLSAVTACGSDDPPAGGLTPDQNAALDSAAQTLDAQQADLAKRDGQAMVGQDKSSAPPAKPSAASPQ